MFDKSVRPQDDFFGYVNNNWIKNNPIPPSESTWGTFYELRDRSAAAVNDIVEELTSQPDDRLSHDQQLIKRFFTVALAFNSHHQNHLETLSRELNKIDAIADKKELASYLGEAHRHDFRPFWSGYVSLDDKNSNIQVLRFYQDGLCLPNRDYYLDKDERMKGVRAKYADLHSAISGHLKELAPADWNAIMSIETSLARASWTDVALRDVEKSYNRFTLKELAERFSGFNWTDYFKALGWNKPTDNIVIDQPDYLTAVLSLIDSTPLQDIKAYLAWQVINRLLGWLDEDSAKLHFDFYGHVIAGKEQNNPVWKRAVLQADSLILGEIIGREYASRYFPESSKQSVLSMVEDIRAAFDRRIDGLAWLTDATKQRAKEKLANIRVLAGYPSKWQDMSRLDFTSDNHLDNLLRARAFHTDIELAKVGQKPPEEDWHMHAHTVNAYHNPNQLVICFPAAILQPPFYDPAASYSTNLGGIGAVIGHEFTHGFDDQGSQFDEHGNVEQWQSFDERAAFKQEADKMVAQANQYEAAPGVNLQGELILGEALADIGGLTLACEALDLKGSAEPAALQELFIGAAIAERGYDRIEHAIRQAKTDPHPPSPFRVNSVLPHIDAFYKAYNVEPSDKLYLAPEARVRIW